MSVRFQAAGAAMGGARSKAAPLLMAAENGHADSVRSLLEGRAAPTQIRSQDGAFPLLRAAQTRHTDSVRALLENYGDFSMVRDRGDVSLITEVLNTDPDFVVCVIVSTPVTPVIQQVLRA